MPRTLAVAAVLVGVLVVAGCTSSSADNNTAPASPTPKAPTPRSSSALQQNPLPTKLPTNQPKVRADVVQTRCAAIPGGWGAAGTVKNPGKKKREYHILVFFTTTRATTLDYASTEVAVPAGKTVAWRADKKFAAQPKMLCPMPSISVS